MTPDWNDQRDALREWLLSHPRILIGCDFDGTLTTIVSHADDARMPVHTRTTLERLVSLPGVACALISGRSLTCLQERVALAGALYAGNHGLEMASFDGKTVFAPGAEALAPSVHQVVILLTEQLAHIPGVWVEDKLLSASVHYRMAAEDRRAEIEALVRAAVQDMEGLHIRPAKRIWEIRPTIPADKGTALRWFMEQCHAPSSATAFMGDDVSDLDAFRELPDGWTFMVGNDLPSTARVHLNTPDDTTALLEWMTEVRSIAKF